jgi:hypothetical protein
MTGAGKAMRLHTSKLCQFRSFRELRPCGLAKITSGSKSKWHIRADQSMPDNCDLSADKCRVLDKASPPRQAGHWQAWNDRTDIRKLAKCLGERFIMVHQLLNAEEAAEILRMDTRTIIRWARLGYLPAHPLGEGKRKVWRFLEHELLQWVEARESDCKRSSASTINAAINAHARRTA